MNPCHAKLIYSDFHPLEVVSRWRDPQLQVSENYLDLTKMEVNDFKILLNNSRFIFNMYKRWY